MSTLRDGLLKLAAESCCCHGVLQLAMEELDFGTERRVRADPDRMAQCHADPFGEKHGRLASRSSLGPETLGDYIVDVYLLVLLGYHGCLEAEGLDIRHIDDVLERCKLQ